MNDALKDALAAKLSLEEILDLMDLDVRELLDYLDEPINENKDLLWGNH